MKFILELILVTIIIFFLWNMLKRLFFSTFYKFPSHRKNEENVTVGKDQKNLGSKLNWDAETVEYEEVKEEGSKK